MGCEGRVGYLRTSLVVLAFGLANVPVASAVQPHLAPEGYVVHQLAHMFFLVTMAYLIVRFALEGKLRRRGWVHLGVAAGFFVLWNVDTLIAHVLLQSSRPSWLLVTELSVFGTVPINSVREAMTYLTYMDNLFAVPAVYFLYRGLRELNHRAEAVDGAEA